jgi:hypothetical protein
MRRLLWIVPLLLLGAGFWAANAAYSYVSWGGNVVVFPGYLFYEQPGVFAQGEIKLATTLKANQPGWVSMQPEFELIWNADTNEIEPKIYSEVSLSSYGIGSAGGAVIGNLSVNLCEAWCTTPLSVQLSVPENPVLRVVRKAGQLLLYVNNELKGTVAVGALHPNAVSAKLLGGGSDPNTPPQPLLSSALVGPLDTVPPTLNSSGVTTAAFVDHIDIQWPAAIDADIGLYHYQLFRNGGFLTSTNALSFSDTAVLPNHIYTYTLKAYDFHMNEVSATFTVATPVNVLSEGRRTGVRPSGAYWGAGSENIDVMSGNLNFSLPLLSAQARGGWSANVGLSYDSQSWRWDPASSTTWKYSADVGYGFGWKLQIGSVFPVFSDPYTLNHYLFTDSTGAKAT